MGANYYKKFAQKEATPKFSAFVFPEIVPIETVEKSLPISITSQVAYQFASINLLEKSSLNIITDQLTEEIIEVGTIEKEHTGGITCILEKSITQE